MIVTLANFADVVSRFEQPGEYAVDTETTGLRVWLDHKLFSIIIADQAESYYFNFQDYKDGSPVLPRAYIKKMRGIFGNEESLFFAHHASFDMAALWRAGIDRFTRFHCTQSIGRVVRNDLFSYKLAALVRPLGIEKSEAVDEYIAKHKLFTTEIDLKGKKVKIPHYDQVPFPIISEYGMQDARITYALGKHQQGRLKELSATVPPGKATPLELAENEIELTRTCFHMERQGVRIDRVATARGAEHERARVTSTLVQFKKLTGVDFVDSAKCLAPAFDKLDCRYPLTDKGNPSFTDEVLADFNNPVAQLVRDYRGSAKRLNTYYMNFLKFADSKNLIHAQIRQSGTEPGRMSYADPNFQNLPKRKEEKGEFKIRGCVIPPDGFALAMLDYDQMEYRLMLDYAGEMRVIEQILAGLDVHEATASMMGVTRDQAKTLNFMLLYGGGVAKLCVALFAPTLELDVLKELVNTHFWKRPRNPKLIAELPRGVVEQNMAELCKAKDLQDLYFAKLPKVRKFTKGVADVAAERGYIRNWAGRVCFFAHSSRAYAAPNHLIQGGCADVVKIAMNRIAKLMKGRRSFMSIQVHDELLFAMHPSEFSLLPEIKGIMETVYPGKHLPLTVGVDHSWKSWADKIEGFPT
jgi:DNA polymerase I-like protein with 3'-5' exonuclease and polymerase domains